MIVVTDLEWQVCCMAPVFVPEILRRAKYDICLMPLSVIFSGAKEHVIEALKSFKGTSTLEATHTSI